MNVSCDASQVPLKVCPFVFLNGRMYLDKGKVMESLAMCDLGDSHGIFGGTRLTLVPLPCAPYPRSLHLITNYV